MLRIVLLRYLYSFGEEKGGYRSDQSVLVFQKGDFETGNERFSPSYGTGIILHPYSSVGSFPIIFSPELSRNVLFL